MLSVRVAVLIVSVVVLRADDHSVESDPDVDFARFRTFAIRQMNITSRRPELNSPLVRDRIADSIREQLSADGLESAAQQPDLIVNFRFGAANRREVQSWPTGRFGRGRRIETYNFTEGTLVIDILDSATRQLIWRGIYNDEERDAAKLAQKLPDDVKKLFGEFPPKKK